MSSLPGPLHAGHRWLLLALVFTTSGCGAMQVSEPGSIKALVEGLGEAARRAEGVTDAGSSAAVSSPSVIAVASPSPSAPGLLPSTSPAPSARATASPAPAKHATPKKHVVRLKPRPRPGPFEIDLYRKGDFVHQQTKEWCVAGSVQTMINIMDRGRPHRSTAFQKRLYREGRRLSRNKKKLGPIGVDLTGWARLLNTKGYGPYVIDGANTRAGAIRKAAIALRMTGRPVGLVTWRGAHSWVMSGFTASADPAYSNRFKVRTVFIEDVWYPWVSTIWGASRPPDSEVRVAALAEDYLPYRRPLARWPARDGRFMLILPTLPANTVAR